METRPLNAGEKAELGIIERRMNHLTVAAGSLGMILYSIVDYFLAPALWQEFLFMRIGFTLYGSCIMIVTMIRKVGNQGGLYLF